MMKPRLTTSLLLQRLKEEAAVVLTGPRQVGKTTLALHVAKEIPAVYLDLEAPSDRARLSDPELYLGDHMDKLVILDEVHRTPGLFPVLRGLIDRARRAGAGTGRYLLLGSASPVLLRQSGESLAGRVSYIELSPFVFGETGQGRADWERLWVRGGFPESWAAPEDGRSLRWRNDFITTYLERDIPQFGATLSAEVVRRLWTMLAHGQGGLLNSSTLSRGLGIDVRTVNRYIDLLEHLMLLRRLTPWQANVGKRLVKSPKLYIRDSGITHALLDIETMDQLLSHPVVGPSWEAFVIEQILNLGKISNKWTGAFFYRTAAGAELDLLMTRRDGTIVAFEIKRSHTPAPGKGFWSALEDLRPAESYIVYPGSERYPLGHGVTALPLSGITSVMMERN